MRVAVRPRQQRAGRLREEEEGQEKASGEVQLQQSDDTGLDTPAMLKWGHHRHRSPLVNSPGGGELGRAAVRSATPLIDRHDPRNPSDDV